MEKEYWKKRALVAEDAADKLGTVVGMMLPYVNIPGTTAYDTYQRWVRWKEKRNSAMIKEVRTTTAP